MRNSEFRSSNHRPVPQETGNSSLDITHVSNRVGDPLEVREKLRLRCDVGLQTDVALDRSDRFLDPVEVPRSCEVGAQVNASVRRNHFESNFALGVEKIGVQVPTRGEAAAIIER